MGYTGNKELYHTEKVGEKWVTTAKMNIEIKDKEKAEQEWVKAVLAEITDDTMTKADKLKEVQTLHVFPYGRK